MLNIARYTYSDSVQRKAERREQELRRRKLINQLYRQRVDHMRLLNEGDNGGGFNRRIIHARETAEYQEILQREKQINQLRSASNNSLSTLDFDALKQQRYPQTSRLQSAGTVRRGVTSSRTRLEPSRDQMPFGRLMDLLPEQSKKVLRLHSSLRNRMLLLKNGSNTFRV